MSGTERMHPVDTSVNTCKPELRVRPDSFLICPVVIVLIHVYESLNMAKSLKHSENKYFIKYIVSLFIGC